MKSALVALVGRPSSGKSTILNTICGHKIAIVAPTPQTTRNTVRGILSEERGQLVFLDTPGFHDSGKKLNRHLRRLAESSLEESDLVLYVMDAARRLGGEEQQLMRRIAESGLPAIVALNKIDLGTRRLAELQQAVTERLPEAIVYPVSAKKGRGIGDLATGLFLHAPEGELMYPEEYYTDQDPEFRISEVIREKAVTRLREELPHALYVEIADTELAEEQQKLWVRAVIFVERESQKGIVVGKGGTMIKAIRQGAEAELAELFPYKVELDLRVKTAPNWQKDDHLLGRMIH
jgi:GTP-binding protein Era